MSNRLFSPAFLLIAATTSIAGPNALGQGPVFTSLQGWRDWVNGSFPPPTYGYIEDLLALSVVSPGSTGHGGVHGGALHYVWGDFSADGEIIITSVHGSDMDPSSLSMTLGGFDPSNPAMLIHSPEIITSTRTGREFVSSSPVLVSVSELSTVYLPDFDLTRISMIDPHAAVYVTQMTVPAADFIIPSPASLSLLGLSGLLATRRRR